MASNTWKVLQPILRPANQQSCRFVSVVARSRAKLTGSKDTRVLVQNSKNHLTETGFQKKEIHGNGLSIRGK